MMMMMFGYECFSKENAGEGAAETKRCSLMLTVLLMKLMTELMTTTTGSDLGSFHSTRPTFELLLQGKKGKRRKNGTSLLLCLVGNVRGEIGHHSVELRGGV